MSLASLDIKLNQLMDVLLVTNNKIQEICNEHKDIIRSINSCHRQITELNGTLYKLEVTFTKCTVDLQQLKTETNEFTASISDLKAEVEDLKRNSHRNSLIIHGIPETKEENVYETLTKLAEHLQIDGWHKSMVDVAHRLKQNTNSPSAIIARFVQHANKLEFLKRRKVFRNLKAHDLGYASESRIYVNESLTPDVRRLLALAREKKRQLNMSHVWTNDGKILMRKKDGDRVIQIRVQADLDKLT